MKKVMKQLFRQGLCGVLCAAMILTSLSIPEVTVHAAEPGITADTTGETTQEETTPETPGEDTEEAGINEPGSDDEGGASSGDNLQNPEEDDNIPPADDTDTNPDTDEENPPEDENIPDEETPDEDGDLETDEPEEDVKLNPVEEKDPVKTPETRTYNTLQNGEFEEVTGADGNSGDLVAWTGSGADYKWRNEEANNKAEFSGHGKTVNYYVEKEAAAEAMSLSQVIENIQPGIYTLSLEALGEWAEDSIAVTIKRVKKDSSDATKYTDVDSQPLAVQDLGAGAGWDTWKDVMVPAFTIEVPTGETEVSIDITIAGVLAAGNYIDLDNVELLQTYTKEQLTTLLEEAGKLNESDYTAASWTAFQEAKEAAQAIVDDTDKTDGNSASEITLAYISLQKAQATLVLAADAPGMTFYYYNNSIAADAEVGLYYWGSNITTTAEQTTTWHGGNKEANTNTYLMEPVTGYTGWYSIPLKFENSGADSGFSIHTSKDSGTAALYECDAAKDGTNYTKLAKGTDTEYAIKNNGTNNICYEGEDMVTAIMRNVTFYAYDASAVPVIMIDAGAAALSKVDEGTAELKELTPDAYTDEYKNTYYSMQPEEGKDGWYSLTFSAPGSRTLGGGTICKLYALSNSAYAWKKDLVNGKTENNWELDFTPVFSGSIYYKDGVLLSSRSRTLEELKDLIEAANAIIKEGKGEYSEESWNALQTAINQAQQLVDAESNDGEEITSKYTALENALNNLAVRIKFYYYVGKTEAAGFVYYWHDAVSPIRPVADTADWTADWKDSSTYAMTAVEDYPGWYSISVDFTNDGGVDAGFAIYKKENLSTSIFDCSKKWENVATYAQLVSGNSAVYAVKGGQCYEGQELIDALMRSITLHVYDSEGIPAIGAKSKISYIDGQTIKELEVSETKDDVHYYKMTADENNTNWYYLTFSAPAADETSKEIGGLYRFIEGETESTYTQVKTFVEKTVSGEGVDFREVFDGPTYNGTAYYKNGKFYASRPATVDDLRKLVEEAEALKESEEEAEKNGTQKYQHDDAWETFLAKLTAAQEVVAKDGTTTEPTDEEIVTAYAELDAAMKALTPVPLESETINVEHVAIADDFITGVDVSSYVSLRDSGVVFKDENGKALSDAGFFKLLHDGGTNWVRIRIWNDPYNSTNGNGYGGGNSDLEKAKIIGKLATDAGMKVLIDFHYSDFWADPAKQDAPKAWSSYTIDQKVEAVYDYTKDSLAQLRNAGVEVCMVQVGNETNNGICGEYTWDNMAKIFNAGSKAVREFDKDCRVAIHFAEPQSTAFLGLAASLDEKKVDYDVFASSYYPFWHGTTSNLTEKLTQIAQEYGKEVMVAETSWVTSWKDGDGHGNSAPKTSQELNYPVSLQGQADEIRDVVDAVNKVNENEKKDGAAIGVFYWEPAWISPYYVYNADGSIDQSLYKKNQELWEKYGSGWASSYAIEYDPSDAGLWYGGSAVDNQSWFDFEGKALETTQIYNYIRTSAVAKNATYSIVNVEENVTQELKTGDTIPWDKWNNIVKVTFSNGGEFYAPETVAGTEDKKEPANPIQTLEIKWDEEQKKQVSTDKAGQYVVPGIVTCTYKLKDGSEETKTESFDTHLTIVVQPTGNLLENPGFDDAGAAYTPWKAVQEPGDILKVNDEGVRSGNGLHFYNKESFHFTVEQEVKGIEAGLYTFGGYIQGGGAADTDLQYAYVKAYSENNTLIATYKTSCSLGGYLNWMNPEITGIKVSQGDYLVVGMEVTSTEPEAWGTIDDLYLYGAYGVKLDTASHGKITASNLEASSGEVITITATPDNGYYLSRLTVRGADVSKIGLTGVDGTLDTAAAAGTAVLNYSADVAARSDATKMASFTMPNGVVTVSAEFVSMFGDTKVKIADVTVEGFTADAAQKYVYNTKQEYTGKNIELDLNISYQGYQLTTADYTAKYSNNKKVGEAKITLKAKGSKFEGTRDLYFEIVDTKTDISKAKIEWTKAYDNTAKKSYYYTGSEIELGKPSLTDKNGNALKDKNDAVLALTEDDYTIKYQNNIKVGKATVLFIAKDTSSKIKGSISQTFTIAKRPITDSGITISKPLDGTYTGSKVTPNVTVKYGNTVLQKGKDYKVAYYNNTNVSTTVTDPRKLPYLKITGIGNYTGSTDKYNGTEDKITFAIGEKSLSDYSVTAVATDLTYQKKNATEGKDLAVKISVKNGTKALSANKQYRIAKIVDSKENLIYEYDKETKKATEASKKRAAKVSEKDTYTVTLEGLGNYIGEKTVTFKVVEAQDMLSNAKITKIPNQTYTGSRIELKGILTVIDKNGKELKYGEDYKATYTNNLKAGTAKVTIEPKDKDSAYAGTKSATFKIVKRAIKKEADLVSMTDDAKAKVGVISYEFPEGDVIYKDDDGCYYYPYTGYNWTPEFKVYSTNNGAKKALTKGVDYTISYKNNQKPNDKLGAGKYASITISGKGSYSGKVTFADVFKVKDVTLGDFVITVNPVVYSGKAIKPAVTFVYKETGSMLNVKSGTAYSVSYARNTNAASVVSTTQTTEAEVSAAPQVTIKEKGMRAYKQDSTGKWVAAKAGDKKSAPINFTITTATITTASVSDIKVQTYSGKPVRPAVTIKVNGRKLKAGKDYLITYQGNTKRNEKATATIVGIGNYSGQVEKTFVIK
ncbi:MAG: glycosyl hydrolase 53 family protein [Muribaculaceae bacterium]|nr:glycosyl hydrolase 53 family protein [Muribaculaceae bacterium]